MAPDATASTDDLTHLFKSTSSTLKSLSSLFSLKSSLTTLLSSLSLPTSTTPGSTMASTSKALLNEKNLTKLDKLVPALQTVLVEWVLPSWWDAIREDEVTRQLLEECFAARLEDEEDVERTDSDDEAEQPGRRGRGRRDSLQDRIRNKIVISGHLILSSAISSSRTPILALPGLIHLAAHLISHSDLQSTYTQLYPRLERATSSSTKIASDLMWADLIKTWTSWPVRIGNAWGRMEEEGAKRGVGEMDLPDGLKSRPYFDRFVSQLWDLLYTPPQAPSSGQSSCSLPEESPDISSRPVLWLETDSEPITDLLVKLQRIGLLNPPYPRPEHSPSPSFFTPIFASLLDRLHSVAAKREATIAFPASFWPDMLGEMPQATAQAYIHSFFLHLVQHLPRLVPPATPAMSFALIRAAAQLFTMFAGQPVVDNEVWRLLLDGIVLGRNGLGRDVSVNLPGTTDVRLSGEESVRVIVTWVTGGGEKAVIAFLRSVLSSWGDGQEVKYTTYGRQLFLTHLIILSVSQLRPMHPIILDLAFDSKVLQSIQFYLSHSDSAIRRLGMLVAEIISQLGVPVSDPEGIGAKGEQDNAESQKELEGLLGELDAEENGDAKPARPTNNSTTGRREMKRLDFGKEMWEGKGQGKEECRRLRSFLGVRDVLASLAELSEEDWLLGWTEGKGSTECNSAASATTPGPSPTVSSSRGRPERTKKAKPASKPKVQVDSDDDSLIGYSSASSPSSSRSPSPTPSYLEEIANDPSLHTSTRKKVQRPVYIAQLLELLRAHKEPDKLEVALKWGESLIRRKRDFGTELQENAVALGVQILNLNDNYNLEDFETRRQGLLIALTTCCPKLVAPFLAQQYFDGEYSLLARTTILSALAMGGRELAGLATVKPPSLPSVDFPSKMLPGKMHRKFVTEGDVRPGMLEIAAADVGQAVLEKAREGTEDMVPKELVRTRRLRPTVPSSKGKIQEVGGYGALQANDADRDRFSLTARAAPGLPAPIIPYSDVAGEYFILPMINRFWIHFQDESTRETRTRRAVGGTGMILSPLAMSKYLATLSILIHAARNSSLFLAVIAPEGLELAITVGARLAQRSEVTTLSGPESGVKEFESDVVGAALELALVCLDGSKESDNGRTLALGKASILMAAGEWASGLFESERKGESVAVNSGGQSEGRTRKAAAGVVVLVAGIVERMQGLIAGV